MIVREDCKYIGLYSGWNKRKSDLSGVQVTYLKVNFGLGLGRVKQSLGQVKFKHFGLCRPLLWAADGGGGQKKKRYSSPTSLSGEYRTLKSLGRCKRYVWLRRRTMWEMETITQRETSRWLTMMNVRNKTVMQDVDRVTC
jgi:hypothetical protein